ncbi:MAG: cytochrome c-type biogenesis protein CcmH [Deltaproteobacteria bacterium]|nr:cytochrome c-type biogenesis protein CcmH [Deltaproteobacteria bacterium]
MGTRGVGWRLSSPLSLDRGPWEGTRCLLVTVSLLLAFIAISGGPGHAGVAQAPQPAARGAAPTTPETEEVVREIAAQLRCPVCQNLSVGDSPSELANQMRQLIRERVQRGETREQVVAYFVSKYGEWILLEPPARGLNLIPWLAPFVALLAGGAGLFWTLRRWARRPHAPSSPAPGSPAPASNPEYAKRLAQELRDFEV